MSTQSDRDGWKAFMRAERVKAESAERDTLARALWSADAAYRTDEDGTVSDVPFERDGDRDLYFLQADGLMPWLAQVRAEARKAALTEAAEAIRGIASYGCELRPDGREDPGMTAWVEGIKDSYETVLGLTESAEPCPACPFPDDRAECCHDEALGGGA